jgi:Ni/Co efflux regulator RcnB
MLTLPSLAGAFLLAAMSAAAAESPMTDPVAPAVLGRPLEHIRPARPVAQKAVVAKTVRPKRVAATAKAAPPKGEAPVVAAPAIAAAPAVAAVVPAAAQAAPGVHAPKRALDDRVDGRAAAINEVGKGTVMGRKALGPGAFFGARHQAVVRKYYEAHAASGAAAKWKIGEPLPPKASLAGVPDEVRAALPAVPPGHQYVQLDGEVVLVALPSRMVVDGISRSMR